MYKKQSPRYALSIEQGTENTPDDDQYHVIVEGEIFLSTKVFDLAKITYEEQREELRIKAGHPDPRVILRNENAKREMRELRGQGVADRARRNRGSGPGGRGGV